MFGSPRVRLASAALAALAAAACSTGETSTPATTTVPITAAETTTTTSAVVTAPTTVPDTSTSAPEPTTTTSSTTLPPTTTTTEPLAVQELVLREDGLGSARFGAAPDGVIDYVTSVLGGTTGDTDWVDPFTFADCGYGGLATEARRVDWGVLSLLFSDASRYATERQHFIGFEYGRVGQIGDDPEGLRTPGGVTLGSRVVDVLAEFPDAFVNEGEPELGIPDNFYVSDVLYGLLTGTEDDDVVTVIFGGNGCGE